MESVRVVIPGAHELKWAMRGSFSTDATMSTHAKQSEAIAAARASLGTAGGLIRVCGLDGQLRRTIRVPSRAAGVTNQPRISEPTKLTADAQSSDALPTFLAGVDIGASMIAHANGAVHDADGDGTDDGEAAIERLLRTHDGSPASLFFKGVGGFVNVLLTILLPLAAAFLGIQIQGVEVLGTTWFSVYLATVAWSGGISVVSFMAFLQPRGWRMGHYVATAGGGFAASNVLAGLLGGATAATPGTLAIPDLYRVLAIIPKNRQGFLAVAIAALVLFIWLVALAGIASYGFVGLVLGALVGVAIGWQAAHRIKTSAVSEAHQPSRAP